jgi:1-aminocyclopropane-1-carboxylate deaminase/D-cysteine desulfhydrase-like pyridoxal-dependent ACC family enzyme
MSENNTQTQLALFEAFPALEEKIPRIPIGRFPTPAQETPALADALGVGRLFVKRDDLTHPVYGGNKVRKLEFILADAVKRGYKKVITFGGIGSNHFLATTIHAAEHGLGTIGVLVPQPVTEHVKHNMLCDIHFGAEMHLAGGYAEATAMALKVMAETALKDGKPPYLIPTGGSAVAGVIGYVNAAFELKRQIEEGALPEPDYIFVAVGTAGTASGLIAGCRAAGLKTRVVGVKVTDWVVGNTVVLSSLANQVTLKLFALDRKFPLNLISPLKVELLTDYFGEEYGRFTSEGVEAIEMVKQHTGLELEGVYTGKAFAGLAGTARKKDLSGKTVVFWNTYNSSDLSTIAAQHGCSELPKEFRQFFECPEHTHADV